MKRLSIHVANINDYNDRLKKVITILLLAILLLNTYGYRFLISFGEQLSEKSWQTTLDQGRYNDDQLLVITVPAYHFSAYANQHDYTRANGKIEIAGVTYDYLEMRWLGDSLQLVCVRDNNTMQWKSVKAQFFAIANDLDHKNAKNRASGLSKTSLSSDFIITAQHLLNPNDFFIADLLKHLEFASALSWHNYPRIDNPPETFI